MKIYVSGAAIGNGIAHEAVNVGIPGKQGRVDSDETRVSVAQMKDVLQEEDYPVKSVG